TLTTIEETLCDFSAARTIACALATDATGPSERFSFGDDRVPVQESFPFLATKRVRLDENAREAAPLQKTIKRRSIRPRTTRRGTCLRILTTLGDMARSRRTTCLRKNNTCHC